MHQKNLKKKEEKDILREPMRVKERLFSVKFSFGRKKIFVFIDRRETTTWFSDIKLRLLWLTYRRGHKAIHNLEYKSTKRTIS